MSIALWIVEGLLGLIFVITGSFKLFQSRDKVIASGGTWAEDFAPGVIKVIAAVELVSGVLVIVPRLLGHETYFSFGAAACIALIMIGSIYTHIRRKEFTHAMINCLFFVMALYVVYNSRPV